LACETARPQDSGTSTDNSPAFRGAS
jgi:hypothetical protein